MTELIQLFVSANIRTALIIDDSFDSVPLANDILIDVEEWRVFFEDITEENKAAIVAEFPLYEGISADELQQRNDFVEVLWHNKDTFAIPALCELFKRYERDQSTDIAHLEALIANLTALEITCERAGRDFIAAASTVDLVFIDLFMGSAQDEDAISLSIEGLKTAITPRRSSPPIVLLMSRSHRLEAKRAHFRDSVGIFESSFRIISKIDTADISKLHRILFRLAEHHGDSWKLATFLSAWQDGLHEAVARTTSLIRRLDLADYAQIRHLLLTEEGEPTGSYLVDVLDYVMLHEMEGTQSIINAAIGLNDLDPSKYPPPYVSGSKDLQLLVYKSSFQHCERLKLPAAINSRLAFGDILRRKAADSSTPDDADVISNQLRNISREQVLLVMTPACDLQRAAAERVLLLVGKLEPLHPMGWSYRELPIRTPVIIMPGGDRYTIKWNIKNLITVTHQEIEEVFAPNNGFEICARLRYLHALEIQQKLLAGLGRVGLTAPIPATFRLEVKLYTVSADKKPAIIDLPSLASHGGVCYVGKIEQSPMLRLVICEDACDNISDRIRDIPQEQVHELARPALAKLLENDAFTRALERGLPLPHSKDTSLKEVKLDEAEAVAWICRDSCLPEMFKESQIRKAGLIITIKDVDVENSTN